MKNAYFKPSNLVLISVHLNVSFSTFPTDKPATLELQLEPTPGAPNTVSINLPAAKWQRVESRECILCCIVYIVLLFMS